MIRIAALAILGTLLISTQAQATNLLPEAFKGTWNSNCEVPDDIDLIHIDNNEFGYWEKIATVESIKVISDSEISVSLHFSDNDGFEWDETRSYKITEQKLVETIKIPDSIEQRTEIRRRCGKAK
ncbi:hypothetical protein EMM73_07990 [Rheinheimera sediminis]|nr:hypothetical protein EMM73_07990 [Rheinheimera sp. YQF-1]